MEQNPNQTVPLPRIKGIYKARVTQNGTNAPTVTVRQNTIGDVVWARLGVGLYTATCNEFQFGKVDVSISQANTNNIAFARYQEIIRTQVDVLSKSFPAGAAADSAISGSEIIITLYR